MRLLVLAALALVAAAAAAEAPAGIAALRAAAEVLRALGRDGEDAWAASRQLLADAAGSLADPQLLQRRHEEDVRERRRVLAEGEARAAAAAAAAAAAGAASLRRARTVSVDLAAPYFATQAGEAGTLAFTATSFNATAPESLVVGVRCANCSGNVFVFVQSEDESAQAWRDYAPVFERLVWTVDEPSAGDTRNVTVQLLPRTQPRPLSFALRLVDNSPGTALGDATARVNISAALFCGRGTKTWANRTNYTCDGARVSAAEYAARTTPPPNTTCAAALSFFDAASFNDSAAAARVAANCSAAPPNDTQLATQCGAWAACRAREVLCGAPASEQREVCYCPLDFAGESCSEPVPARCALAIEAPAQQCAAAAQVAAGFDALLDGAPPCAQLAADTRLEVSARCAFTRAAAEGPPDAASLTAQGWEWAALNLSALGQYAARRADNTFAVSFNASRTLDVLPVLRVLAVNPRRLADRSAAWAAAASPALLEGRANASLVLDTSALAPRFAAGGRVTLQVALDPRGAAALAATPRFASLEVPGYAPPGAAARGLGAGLVAGLALLSVGVVALCAGGYLWKRSREGDPVRIESVPLLGWWYDRVR
jgi:hypothetical protein